MMGKVIMSGIVPPLVAPVNYKANFADNTWEQIIDACQKNAVPDTWLVGDQKTMTINGTDYLIDIIGKNHDTYTAGGKAPLTFQMHDCYGTTYAMHTTNSNADDWTGCAMRTTYLPAIKALMPPEVQNSIKAVDKLTLDASPGYNSLTTSDELFLLSETEIAGAQTYTRNPQGTQYDYYKAGNSMVKNINGSPTIWWTRCPNSYNTHSFCARNTSGAGTWVSSGYAYGVSCAFCF